LIERLIEEFKNTGTKLVVGRTWETNIPSINLFEKSGFKFLKRLEKARVTGEDTIWYYLELVEGSKDELSEKLKLH